MKYLFLILFFLFSSIHLVHSWQDDSKKRAITKPFLLLALDDSPQLHQLPYPINSSVSKMFKKSWDLHCDLD